MRVKLESKREMKNPEECTAALQILEEEKGRSSRIRVAVLFSRGVLTCLPNRFR